MCWVMWQQTWWWLHWENLRRQIWMHLCCLVFLNLLEEDLKACAAKSVQWNDGWKWLLMALSREYFCSPSYCSLDKPVPGIACVVKRCCQKLCLFHQCICPVCEDALVFNKKEFAALSQGRKVWEGSAHPAQVHWWHFNWDIWREASAFTVIS